MLNELVFLSQHDRGARVCLKGAEPFDLDFASGKLSVKDNIVHANVFGKLTSGGTTRETMVAFNANDILYVQTLERR